jgi:SPP1 family predicted phage head-tail adaptor
MSINKITPASFRHRITFEKEVKTSDGHKGFTVTWQPVAVAWASIEPLSGREYFFAHQITTEVTHRIRIRYREDLNTKMRIILGERVFSIESMIDIEECRCFMELLCKEEG